MIRMIRVRRLRLAGNVARMGTNMNACRDFDTKARRKKTTRKTYT
jgi:hypothetical protein